MALLGSLGSRDSAVFPEFVAARDARAAAAALTSTHLYGRRLVIEWAEDGDGTGGTAALGSAGRR